MITPEQRERRRAHIGSSDTPAILGLSPWATAADVWVEKVYGTADRKSDAMDMGNRMEPVILDWCAERLGEWIRRDVECDPVGVMAANLDGQLRGRPTEGVEAKYTTRRDGWGDDGTDQVPDHVLLQVQHQMCVAGLERVWVPAAIVSGGRLAFHLYCVPRDEQLIGMIRGACERFWRDHVETRIQPAASMPSLDVMTRMHRDDSAGVVALGDDVAEAWDTLETLREQIRDMEKAADEAKRVVLAALGDATAGTMPGGRLVTYRSQRGAPSIDTKRLKIDHPEIWNEYAEERSHRVLRVKGGK